jgi:hypothetical protein
MTAAGMVEDIFVSDIQLTAHLHLLHDLVVEGSNVGGLNEARARLARVAARTLGYTDVLGRDTRGRATGHVHLGLPVSQCRHCERTLSLLSA